MQHGLRDHLPARRAKPYMHLHDFRSQADFIVRQAGFPILDPLHEVLFIEDPNIQATSRVDEPSRKDDDRLDVNVGYYRLDDVPDLFAQELLPERCQAASGEQDGTRRNVESDRLRLGSFCFLEQSVKV